MLRTLRAVHALTKWSRVRLGRGRCTLCGGTLFVKLDENEWAVRCLFCRAAPNSLALGVALRTLVEHLDRARVYVMSAGGPLYRFLRRSCGDLTCSLFMEDVPRGAYRGGVQCQDVQQLTYGDGSFDVCVCSEVFEHVPDDIRGFSEVLRVLKPQGLFAFTVPLNMNRPTVERARIRDGRTVHLLPPTYHNESLRGRVLCFRDYGADVLDRLAAVGFEGARILEVGDPAGMGFTRPVVVGFKSPAHCR